jgi:hypothetical protein
LFFGVENVQCWLSSRTPRSRPGWRSDLVGGAEVLAAGSDQHLAHPVVAAGVGIRDPADGAEVEVARQPPDAAGLLGHIEDARPLRAPGWVGPASSGRRQRSTLAGKIPMGQELRMNLKTAGEIASPLASQSSCASDM